MGSVFGILIRSLAFLRKEINEIVRQPRLVFTLILGPFLILLIFGIGYQNQARSLRTLFVARSDSPLTQQIEQYAQSLGRELVYQGITEDQVGALAELQRGNVDLVVVAPDDAYEKIQNNEQAVFTMYHREIDPFQRDYVIYFGQFYVDIVNKRVLEAITAEGQTEAQDVKQNVTEARAAVSTMRTALQAGDETTAAASQQQLNSRVDTLALAVGASMGLLNSVQQTMGSSNEDSQASQVMGRLGNVRENTRQLSDQNTDANTRLQKLDQIDSDLAELDTSLTEFQRIDPSIIVSPFRSEARSIAPVEPTPMAFFAPAVLALLLQHLAVTFAALSIVRERSLGTIELFRVSPLSAAEALFGKYLSYLFFGGVITTVLTLLLIYALRLPMLGNWWNYAAVIGGVIFASLGIGFVISIISQTESQAVQNSMIVLLTSVFFSGFIMSLDMISRPVQVISWLLPTTYGTVLLRNIMLRGDPPDLLLLGGLVLIGLVLLALSWLLLRRLLSTARR